MGFQKGNQLGKLNKGRKLPPISEETREKLRKASIRLGLKPPSPLGIKRTPENCKNISNGLQEDNNGNWKGEKASHSAKHHGS